MRAYSPLVMWQVAFTYVGTVIGAGFASGQEIVKFFSIFGISGIWGTFAAGLLFAVLGGAVLKTVCYFGIKDYEEYITFLFGTRMSRVINGLITLFLFAGLAVMLVASGSLFSQLFACPGWVGFLATALVLYGILLLDLEGVLWVNMILVPGLIILCVGVAAASLVCYPKAPAAVGFEVNLVGNNWLLASVLYVAYNLVLATVILSSLGHTVHRGGVRGVMAGGIMLGILAAILCVALFCQGEPVIRQELPMLAMAQRISPWAGWAYSFVLWAAILTTALSNGFGLLKKFGNRVAWPKAVIAFGIFIPTLPLLGWRLAQAVAVIYPLLGYLGLIFLAALVVNIIKPQKYL